MLNKETIEKLISVGCNLPTEITNVELQLIQHFLLKEFKIMAHACYDLKSDEKSNKNYYPSAMLCEGPSYGWKSLKFENQGPFIVEQAAVIAIEHAVEHFV